MKSIMGIVNPLGPGAEPVPLSERLLDRATKSPSPLRLILWDDATSDYGPVVIAHTFVRIDTIHWRCIGDGRRSIIELNVLGRFCFFDGTEIPTLPDRPRLHFTT